MGLFSTGILFGAWLQGSVKQEPVQLTEQIVLTVPKTDKEMEKQLLYMAASKGMLEEIHRQKVLGEKETVKARETPGGRHKR